MIILDNTGQHWTTLDITGYTHTKMFSIYDMTFYFLETLLNLFVISNVLYGITLFVTMQIFYFKKITTKWNKQLTNISKPNKQEESEEFEDSEESIPLNADTDTDSTWMTEEEKEIRFCNDAFNNDFNNDLNNLSDDDLFNPNFLRT